MKQRIWIAVCGILIWMLSGCGGAAPVYLEEARETTETVPEEIADTEAAFAETEAVSAETAVQAGEIYVHVCGAVECPGVYKLPDGSRIFEAIELAGGLRPDACGESINQAETLSDGRMIKVLTAEEAAEALAAGEAETLDGGEISAGEEASMNDGGKVNINTADAARLMTLPGIGASKAESILSYRREHGAFSTAEELMNITGIKEGIYAKLKEYITVN